MRKIVCFTVACLSSLTFADQWSFSLFDVDATNTSVSAFTSVFNPITGGNNTDFQSKNATDAGATPANMLVTASASSAGGSETSSASLSFSDNLITVLGSYSGGATGASISTLSFTTLTATKNLSWSVAPFGAPGAPITGVKVNGVDIPYTSGTGVTYGLMSIGDVMTIQKTLAGPQGTSGSGGVNVTFSPVPEPATWFFVLGGTALLARRRRK